MYKKLVMTS